MIPDVDSPETASSSPGQSIHPDFLTVPAIRALSYPQNIAFVPLRTDTDVL